jgi:hypothetical protein
MIFSIFGNQAMTKIIIGNVFHKKFIFLKNELSIHKNLGHATPLDQDQDNY